jgi:hypothetical protein
MRCCIGHASWRVLCRLLIERGCFGSAIWLKACRSVRRPSSLSRRSALAVLMFGARLIIALPTGPTAATATINTTRRPHSETLNHWLTLFYANFNSNMLHLHPTEHNTKQTRTPPMCCRTCVCLTLTLRHLPRPVPMLPVCYHSRVCCA